MLIPVIMKKTKLPKSDFMLGTALWLFILFYYAGWFICFGNTALPSEDFIGNFLPFVHSVLDGNGITDARKLFPAYPYLLAAVTHLIPAGTPDPVYAAAKYINISLIMPFLFISYRLMIIFTGYNTARIGLLFLGTNIYTVYSALNPELEIFMCLTWSLSIYLMHKKTSLSLIPSAITAAVKGDCLAMIPAEAFHKFRETGKIRKGTAAGILSAAVIGLWLILRFLYSSTESTYISEVASRGANLWKFPPECILAAAGFPKWLAMEFNSSGSLVPWCIGIPVTAAALLFILWACISGIRGSIKKGNSIIPPLLISGAGYFITHVLFQNTKDRYAVPLLWIMMLFVLSAIVSHREKLAEILCIRRLTAQISAVISGSGFCFAAYILIKHGHVFSAAGAIISLILLFLLLKKSGLDGRKLICIFLASGTLISLNMACTKPAMDHFGLRRTEFRDGALWFKNNAPSDAKLLISENSVACYYTGMDCTQLIQTETLSADNVPDLIKELRLRRIEYILLDDFYISRLKFRDPNAISRKAPLMKQLREQAPSMPELELMASFPAFSGGTALMYRLR